MIDNHRSQYTPSSYPPPEHDRAYYPPPPSQYPPPPYPPGSSQYPPPSSMAAVHPHGQGPPYMGYRPDVYGQPQPPQVVYQAAAPRQRTAIACRYCRRRKVCLRAEPLSSRTLTDGIVDPLLGLRKLHRRTLHQLPALQSAVHVYSRLVAGAGLCPRSRCLSSLARFAGPNTQRPECAALRPSRTASASPGA